MKRKASTNLYLNELFPPIVYSSIACTAVACKVYVTVDLLCSFNAVNWHRSIEFLKLFTLWY